MKNCYLLFVLLFANYAVVQGSANASHDLPTLDENSHDEEDVKCGKLVQTKTEKPFSKPYFVNFKRMHKSVVMPAGSSVMLECKGDGHPLPNVTWFKNNDMQIQRDLGEIKYRKWSIILEEIVVSDSGQYQCIVCNVVGCINFTYTLEVIESIKRRPIILDFHNITVPVGGTANMSCRAVSSLNYYVTWLKGYQDESSFNSTVHFEESEALPSREFFELHNVTHEQEGWYTCVAANSLGHTMSSAYLKVVDG